MGEGSDRFDHDVYSPRFGPTDARRTLRDHGACLPETCPAKQAALAVHDGEHGRPWDEAHQLRTSEQWADAYRRRHLPVTARDGTVTLRTDETVTALLVPAGLAAVVYDDYGDMAPTLATTPPYRPSRRWAFLVTPKAVPEMASRLDGIGVSILPPGEDIPLPASPPCHCGTAGVWWYEWPRRDDYGRPGPRVASLEGLLSRLAFQCRDRFATSGVLYPAKPSLGERR
jgi:hypothetical protein